MFTMCSSGFTKAFPWSIAFQANVIDPEVGQIRKSDTSARYFCALFEFLRNTFLFTIIIPTYSEEDLTTAVTAYRNSEYTSI
jgi:hypothetical protein